MCSSGLFLQGFGNCGRPKYSLCFEHLWSSSWGTQSSSIWFAFFFVPFCRQFSPRSLLNLFLPFVSSSSFVIFFPHFCCEYLFSAFHRFLLFGSCVFFSGSSAFTVECYNSCSFDWRQALWCRASRHQLIFTAR